MKKSHIITSLLSALAVLALVLTTGCASSERMNRLGWDSDSYSAPKSSRISGGKFDDALVSLRTPVSLQDRQVNVWPFCTVNSRYVSVLWPFIDWDDFGMAVRPFYNQEGNEYSILFPLCAWNPVNGDGWALNTYWDDDCYGMFPLFHVGREPGSFWFAGPFLGAKESFGVVPLFFFGEDLGIVGPVWWDRSDMSTMPETPLLPFACGFFPLFWKVADTNALLPLYLKTPSSFYSLPLWMEKGVDDEGKTTWTDGQYLFLGYWRDAWKRHGFFPFYNVDNGNGEFNHVLLWWWDHNDPDCGFFPLAWFDKDGGFVLPFGGWEKNYATGMDGETEEWTEGNILLLGYWGRNAWGVFPFFRGSSQTSDMKYVGPAWWAYDSDQREYGFFPFFRVERSRGETDLSYLFPAYYWSKDEYGSEFNSIPFARKDYDYPAFRDLASEYERRYLLYDTYRAVRRRFNNASSRSDYITNWYYSDSFRADRAKLMEEEGLTAQEAGNRLDDQIVSTSEIRSDAILPFFEWTRSDDGNRELSFLCYLFDFERTESAPRSYYRRTTTSYSNSILWHILFSQGGREIVNRFGLPETSSHLNVLGFFPWYSSETKYEFGSVYNGFYQFASGCVDDYLRRAEMPDDSEESRIWAKNLFNELTQRRFILNFSPAPGAKQNTVPQLSVIDSGPFALSNEEVFRLCGIDRAISGEMTAKEAETMAKTIMDAVISEVRDSGTETSTDLCFLPLFLSMRETLDKAGEKTTLSSETYTLLSHYENDKDGVDFSLLLGLLGHYTDETVNRKRNGFGSTERSGSLLTLIRSGRESYPTFDDYNISVSLEAFADALDSNRQNAANPLAAEFARARVSQACEKVLMLNGITPAFRDAVTRYRDGDRTEADAQAVLEAVVDMENAVFKGEAVETYGGFYPFFFWDKNFTELNGEESDVSRSWFVLPLLSGGSSSPEGSSLGILCPLLYFGATQNHDAEIPHPGRIIPADANALQASHTIDPIRGETDHYALFLVGTGDETFAQWKEGTDKLVSGLYGTLYQMNGTYGIARLTPAELAQKAPAPTKQSDYGNEFARWNAVLGQVDQAMESLGMKPLDRETPLRDSIPPVLRAIAAEYVQMRTVTSYHTGWGLSSASFECKETGDYQSKVFFGLVSNSQKLGEQEHKSVLGYLYNMDTDGVNTRKFIFPFITTKDAPGFHEWSFLGGLFERSEENGQTGGRIFFFPYGHQPGED